MNIQRCKTARGKHHGNRWTENNLGEGGANVGMNPCKPRLFEQTPGPQIPELRMATRKGQLVRRAKDTPCPFVLRRNSFVYLLLIDPVSDPNFDICRLVSLF